MPVNEGSLARVICVKTSDTIQIPFEECLLINFAFEQFSIKKSEQMAQWCVCYKASRIKSVLISKLLVVYDRNRNVGFHVKT